MPSPPIFRRCHTSRFGVCFAIDPSTHRCYGPKQNTSRIQNEQVKTPSNFVVGSSGHATLQPCTLPCNLTPYLATLQPYTPLCNFTTCADSINSCWFLRTPHLTDRGHGQVPDRGADAGQTGTLPRSISSSSSSRSSSSRGSSSRSRISR